MCQVKVVLSGESLTQADIIIITMYTNVDAEIEGLVSYLRTV